MAFDVGNGGKGGVQPSMNVTPLVDVVLVLLIIFMVVTPMMTKQMEVHIPPDDKEETPAQPPPADAIPPLVLTLAKDGRPRVNGEEIPQAELTARLKRMLNARADKVVFFDAADGVPYGHALALMDLVKGGGIETVAVLADPVANTSPEATPAN